MYSMKYLTLSLMLILTACGGGNSSTTNSNDETSQQITNVPMSTSLDVEKNVTEEITTSTVGTESLPPTVSIISTPPPKQVNKMTANAGDDRNTTVNQPISLTGTVSNAGSNKLSYAWTKGTTLLTTTASFDYTPNDEDALPTAGNRVDILTFTVTTEKGDSFSDMVNITVLNR